MQCFLQILTEWILITESGGVCVGGGGGGAGGGGVYNMGKA